MIFDVTITNTVPTITEVYRLQGYLPRYFAAKANHIDNEVFEISRKDYERFYDNSYVVLGHLKWVIKGHLTDRKFNLYTGNPTFAGGREQINIPGVLTQNTAAVKFLSKRIPYLENHLTNYQEFYDGV